jgi:hypothetical protein
VYLSAIDSLPGLHGHDLLAVLFFEADVEGRTGLRIDETNLLIAIGASRRSMPPCGFTGSLAVTGSDIHA